MRTQDDDIGAVHPVIADDVRLDVCIGVGNRVANASLSGKIYNDLGSILLKNTVNKCFICKIPLDKSVFDSATFRCLFNLRKPVFLQAHVIVIVHAIKADDVTKREISQKACYEIRTNKAGRTGD